MALSTGMIIFQVINRYVPDVLNQYGDQFQNSSLTFAISAVIISTPIFFILMRLIQKNLFSGELAKDSGIRRWLTYFILLISAVVMIGWLIATVNSYLNGEMTMKFFLKALTAIVISGAVFSFYLYDIRRKEVLNIKDKIIKAYFSGAVAAVVLALVSGFLTADSPRVARNQRTDEKIINSFTMIDQGVNEYYNLKNILPQNLDELVKEYNYITIKELQDPITGEKFEYSIVSDKQYQLCAVFRTSSAEQEKKGNYVDPVWRHDTGKQCIKRQVMNISEKTDNRLGQPIKTAPAPQAAPETAPAE